MCVCVLRRMCECVFTCNDSVKRKTEARQEPPEWRPEVEQRLAAVGASGGTRAAAAAAQQQQQESPRRFIVAAAELALRCDGDSQRRILSSCSGDDGVSECASQRC